MKIVAEKSTSNSLFYSFEMSDKQDIHYWMLLLANNNTKVFQLIKCQWFVKIIQHFQTE